MRKRILGFIVSLAIVTGLFTPVYGITKVYAASGKMEQALQWAVSTANDNRHGYSQKNRWGNPDYDCSSFVISALKAAGYDVGGATYTQNMRSALTQRGFTWIPWSSIGSVANLKRGDILLNDSSNTSKQHTEFYLGNSQNVGAHQNYGYPAAGDQTGKEISVSGYYNHPWTGVLRENNSFHNPKGHIDSLNGGVGKINVGGWAVDEDNLSQSLEIHVYIGGPAGTSGAECHVIKANKYRIDVDNALKVGKYHGFEAEIPTSKTGRQEVYVYAINIGGGVHNPLLGHKTVTIQKREYRILLRTWFSESKMGKEVDSFKKGTMYYLCYEIIDSDTGTYTKDLDNRDYAVTETIYKPNGSAGYTYTYNNTNNWIGLRFDDEGTYKGKVTFKINGKSAECTTEGTVKHIHQYKSEVTESATCTSTGVRTYKCTCGARYTEIIQKKEHIVVKDAAKSATCTQTGKTEGSHCAVCGTVMKRQQTVPKTGHKWDAGKISVQATSTTDGVKIFTCTSCGASKTEKIEATGQPDNPQEDTEDDAPEVGDIIRDVSETAEYEVISVEGGIICVEYNESTNSQTAVIRIPDTVETEDGTVCRVTSIAPGAFRNNKNIKKIYIGNYVETIGANAFYKCKNLTTITIGKNVTVIGSNAFSGCGKLTSLTLPSKVKKIGSNAFYGCKSLKKMNIQTTRLTSKGLGKKAFKGVSEKTTVQVPANKLRAYKKLFYRKGLSGKVRMK